MHAKEIPTYMVDKQLLDFHISRLVILILLWITAWTLELYFFLDGESINLISCSGLLQLPLHGMS